MKKFNQVSIGFVSLVLGLILPVAVFAATAPVLGTTGTFGVVSSTYTGNGAATNITGDVCYTSGPGSFAPVISGGSLFTPCTNGADQATALNTLNTQACTSVAGSTLDGIIIAGNAPGTFPPGCYAFSGAINITSGATVTLDLTAPGGDGGNVWVFRSTGSLTTGLSTAGFPSVALAHGASAANVFWAPTATSLGANFAASATPTFIGTIIDPAGITIGQFTNLLGRALDFQTTVTTNANVITVPTASTTATLNVIKHVINNNGGGAVAGAWNLAVTSSNGGSGTGSAAGAESPGTSYTLQAGKAYSVTESGGPSGYLATGSTDCTIASAVANTVYNCTITNDDIAPQLIVNKIVVGGTKAVSDFPLFVSGTPVTSGITNTFAVGSYTVTETNNNTNYTSSFSGSCPGGNISLALGEIKTCTITNTYATTGSAGAQNINIPPLLDLVKVPSPLALPNGPGLVTYTYTLHNIGTVPVSNITLVGDTCSPIKLISGDNNNNNILEVSETWTYNCFTNLAQTHTNTVTATGWANGISAVDIASATVVVGVPIMPPLIHVTKVPNPLALRDGGGLITYTDKVTNPGTVPLSNVRLLDDKCSPVKYISGDTNADSKLDLNETWTYTCQSNLTQTTTNTVTAMGDANGLTATDFAIATVVVSVPGLPKTGFPPQENNVIPFIVMTSGILVSLFLLYVVKKKQNV